MHTLYRSSKNRFSWAMVHLSQGDLLIFWTIGVGAVAAALLVTSWWWWDGERKSKSGRGGVGGKGTKKALAHSPGIRVVSVQGSSAESSNGGWGSSSSSGGGRTKGGDTSKWEQSKQKGDLGYYFAHHITMKELAPEDYTMNGPRLLKKGNTAANGTPTNGSSASSSSARRRPQQISSYSWEDYGEEVRLTFRQSEWEWAKVEPEEIGVEWSPRRFRMCIDSSEYGLHVIDLQRLEGDVTDVRVRKLKSRLVVALVKGGRGASSRKSVWSKLQAAPDKPSD